MAAVRESALAATSILDAPDESRTSDRLHAVGTLVIDWSGRRHGAAQFIWTTEARGGRLERLSNGLEREAATDAVIERVAARVELLVGLDFSFSFPAWWCAQNGWDDGPAVWRAMRDDGEALLAACKPPL